MIERVKELFLCALFAADELNVVDQQDVDPSILVAKLFRALARIALIRSLVNCSEEQYSV